MSSFCPHAFAASAISWADLPLISRVRIEAEELALGVLRFHYAVRDEGEAVASRSGLVVGDSGGDAERQSGSDSEFAAVGVGRVVAGAGEETGERRRMGRASATGYCACAVQ